MTDIAAMAIPSSRRLLRGSLGRWLVVAGIALFDLVGFQLARLPPDWASTETSCRLLLLFFVFGALLEVLRPRTARYPAVQKFAGFGADLCFSAVQLALFALVSAPLTYILARLDRPLIDATLGTADHLLGFDWAETSSWIAAHPPIFALLRWAYFTHIQQSWILLMLGSLWFPGRRNGELIWAFMISLLLCVAISAVIPALSMGGEARSYLPVLEKLRSGTPMILDWEHLDGIVSFPSFHAALGVIYIHAARHRLWALIPFSLLDALLIIATPPMGGHYLTDVIGGIAVALVAIALARRLQPASPSASDSRLALPPAAVVSTETTRSAANRAR